MQQTDSDILDKIAEGLRTPEWSASTIEDVAALVGKVRDIESRNTHTAHGEARSPGVHELVPGRDWHSH